MKVDILSAPVLVSWQLTQDCNIACVHCCTESAPGKKMAGEMSRAHALRVAKDIIALEVPYVMLIGGEPLIVPHFFEVAELLGRAGVQLKIETNGQNFGRDDANRLAKLPIRSLQVSLDGDTQDVYGKQRLGGVLKKAHDACALAVEAGLPLEVTFAPTRINIHEAAAVFDRAFSLRAFRFNSGALMNVGTAAKMFDRLEPSAEQYAEFRAMLERKNAEFGSEMEVCYLPFTVADGLEESLAAPPATLLVLPDGRVKVSAFLPNICGELKQGTIKEAWKAYREAWKDPDLKGTIRAMVRGGGSVGPEIRLAGAPEAIC